MRNVFHPHYEKASVKKRSGMMVRTLLFLFTICVGFSSIQATEFKLFRTLKTGNVVTLSSRAKIMQVRRAGGLKGYTIWRNNKPYITMNRIKFTENNTLKGILPPGRYVLLTNGGSVTILLNTVYRPENITLWGRQTALGTPKWDGNTIVVSAPTAIVNFNYVGTDSMGIFRIGENRAYYYYLSAHNIHNPGPKVFNITGKLMGKTLTGLILPPAVYTLTPGRGTADGVVSGQITLTIN